MTQTSKTSPDRATRSARFIALALGIPILLLIIALMSMAFISRDETRLNAVGPLPASPGLEQGGVRFTGTVHVWDVDGRIGANDAREIRLGLDLRGPDGQPPPPNLAFEMELVMPGHDMPPVPVRFERTGIGAYSGRSDSLPMPGRWSLRILFEQITGVLEFEVER